MALPLIGITTTQVEQKSPLPISGVSLAYVQAVQRAGGIPLLIPSGLSPAEIQELRRRLDGILFTGGGDVDPARFNGRPHDRVYGIIPARDETEIGLARLAAESGWPFLGICRGIQVINVALGGTLYTHIADQLEGALKHDTEARDQLVHTVQVEPHTRLERILGGTSVRTNSLHHQGVERLAPGLEAVAHTPDGLVEAVELRGHTFGLCIQWHPEWLQEHAEMRALFEAFIKAARRET